MALTNSKTLPVGATISAPDVPTNVILLPGQYTSNTSPQLLHTLLTSSSAILSPSPGFNGSLRPLPLNLVLEPGVAVFANSLYSGQSAFSSLPDIPIANSSTPLAAQSLSLSSNLWIATTSGSSNQRPARSVALLVKTEQVFVRRARPASLKIQATIRSATRRNQSLPAVRFVLMEVSVQVRHAHHVLHRARLALQELLMTVSSVHLDFIVSTGPAYLQMRTASVQALI
ncbi:hypothetical protein H0H93_006459 [Arthromyces matolae]|nr:hypothetical protein H0H93_006459 [Arthromyces matolae]